MPGTGTDWRTMGGVATAWFDAPSLVVGAEVAGRIADVAPDAVVDLRPTGLRVRLAADEHTGAVSAAAREHDLVADPTALQEVAVVVESPDPPAVIAFWQRVLGYARDGTGTLIDPLRRDPGVAVRAAAETRPLRNRLHLDVARPAAVVDGLALGEASGPYGVRHADPDGNEVDLVPGDRLGDGEATADWWTVFGAVACYRTTSSEQQRDLVTAAATLADAAGFPLIVDARPGVVVLDSGKDRWEEDARFTDLAARLQGAARDLGAVADPGAARFVQLFLDAADVAAVRSFWLAALGYAEDGRAGVTDIVDPRRLNPELVLQALDASETDRRRQRNRSHVELLVPQDVVAARLATMAAGGGRVVQQAPDRWHVRDPEGNELVVRS